MAKIKTKTKTETPVKVKKPFNFMAFMCGLWIVAIMCIMPLFATDAYANILLDKYIFSLIADGVLVAAFIIWALFDGRIKKYFAKMKSFADEETGKWFKNWFKATFNALDICMLALLAAVIVSTLLAYPYMYQAIFGNEGRYMGTIMFLALIITFFIISRHLRFKRGYITAFIIVCVFMALWAISDYFNVDWIGFRYYMTPEYKFIFVSSIGNIDSYNAFMAMPLGFVGWLFVDGNGEGLGKRIFYGISFFVIIVSVITSVADNGYLAIFALVAFAPLFALKRYDKSRRYLVLLALLVSAITLVEYLNTTYRDIVADISGGLFETLSKMPLRWITLGVWVVIAAIYIYEIKIAKISFEAKMPEKCSKVWGIILIVFAVLIVAFVGFANAKPDLLPAWLDPIKKYLVFSDEWGTWRGYVWKLFSQLYKDLPLYHKVFGTGPETACIYLYNDYYYNIAAVTGFLYDSPHNELIQMFFTLGPIGFLSYVGAILSPFVLANKSRMGKYYPYILAIAFAGLCHIFECVVTIVVPMDIPVLFALLAIASNLYRNKEIES